MERGVSGRVFSSFLEVFSYVETESYLLENPVAFCSDTHADCAGFQAPNLCRINPTNWCERHGVDDDEHVREGNDGVGGRAGQENWHVWVTVNPAWDHCSHGKKAGDDHMADTHDDGSPDEQGAAAHFVDIEEHNAGEHDKQSILDS